MRLVSRALKFSRCSSRLAMRTTGLPAAVLTEMPGAELRQNGAFVQSALAEALQAYIDAAGIAEDHKGFLFRTSWGHTATVLSEPPMAQADAWRMIRRQNCHEWRRVAA